MTDSSNTANQTPEEVRQQLLAHLDASKEVVGELSEEELEAVSGGKIGGIMTITSSLMGLMGGGGGAGAGGGTGTGSRAANQHSTTIVSDNHSGAESVIGSLNLSKFSK